MCAIRCAYPTNIRFRFRDDDVVNYAQEANRWMKNGGRAEVAKLLGLPADA